MANDVKAEAGNGGKDHGVRQQHEEGDARAILVGRQALILECKVALADGLSAAEVKLFVVRAGQELVLSKEEERVRRRVQVVDPDEPRVDVVLRNDVAAEQNEDDDACRADRLRHLHRGKGGDEDLEELRHGHRREEAHGQEDEEVPTTVRVREFDAEVDDPHPDQNLHGLLRQLNNRGRHGIRRSPVEGGIALLVEDSALLEHARQGQRGAQREVHDGDEHDAVLARECILGEVGEQPGHESTHDDLLDEPRAERGEICRLERSRSLQAELEVLPPAVGKLHLDGGREGAFLHWPVQHRGHLLVGPGRLPSFQELRRRARRLGRAVEVNVGLPVRRCDLLQEVRHVLERWAMEPHVLEVREDLVARSVVDDATAVEQHDIVEELKHLGSWLEQANHRRQVEHLRGHLQQGNRIERGGCVQAGRDFIGKQDAKVARQHFTGRDALPLAAGDATEEGVADHRVRTALQAQQAKDVVHLGPNLLPKLLVERSLPLVEVIHAVGGVEGKLKGLPNGEGGEVVIMLIDVADGLWQDEDVGLIS
mmetsp:Transcript_19064/g.72081  ORF Transcript_19064/g.72081 Transcript_19064/m.72081 type:complete len:539 (+) Transcript_19064:2482-4098(+)